MWKQLETHLRNTIDEKMEIVPLENKHSFPLSLRDTYEFYAVRFFGIPCLLVEPKENLPRITTLKKHLSRIEKMSGRMPVLVLKKATRYRKKSLIGHRIPFVVEDGQTFLPFVGLNIKNDHRTQIENRDNTFSVTTQVVFLYFLYHEQAVLNTTQLAELLHVTTMTASRALNALYDVGLLTYHIGGRTNKSKIYRRIDDPEFFRKGEPYLKTPIRKTVYVEDVPKGALVSGMEALAERTMLNRPDHETRAMGIKQFKQERIQTFEDVDMVKNEGLIHLEIWDYDPRMFKEGEHVDTLSLYISLKQNDDERIEQALETLLQEKPWYTG